MAERIPSRELDAEIAERLGAQGRHIVYEWHDRKAKARPLIAFATGIGGNDGWDDICRCDFRTYATEDGTKVTRRYFAARLSSVLTSAFAVVEALRAKGWLYKFELRWNDGKRKSRIVQGRYLRKEKRHEQLTTSDEICPPEPFWEARFWMASAEHYGCWETYETAQGSTEAEAICLAALAFVASPKVAALKAIESEPSSLPTENR